MKLAQEYQSEENYKQAIKEYETAISIKLKKGDAYESLADAYLKMEEYNKAVEILERRYEKTEEKEFAKQVEIVKKYITEESTTDTKIRVQEETEESSAADVIIEVETHENSNLVIWKKEFMMPIIV